MATSTIKVISEELSRNAGPSSLDANDFKTTQFIRTAIPSNISNLPSSVGYGCLLAFDCTSYKVQLYFDIGNAALYVRGYNGTAWGSWAKL